METNIEKMYNNLNELLQDICKFLNTDKLKDLSPKDKKLADSLIGRCKVQLQEISKIQQGSPTNDEYVDMNSKKVIEENEEEKNNIYSSVDDTTQIQPTFIEEGAVYPYKDLAAKDASKEVKYGYLSIRKRILLGFEKMKRVYATIHNNCLLIYYSDKDTKPIMTFNLKNYEAKSDNDRNTAFELINTIVEKKVYSFMALTPKDMQQWVVQINRCHDGVILQNKGLGLYEGNDLTNEDDINKYYDNVSPPKIHPVVRKEPEEDPDEDENIYLELDPVSPPFKRNNTNPTKKFFEDKTDIRPALPGRRPIRNVCIPVAPPIVKPLPLPQEVSDDESIVSYDDIAPIEPQGPRYFTNNHKEETVTVGTLTDDEDDCTYEAFVDVQDATKKLKIQNPQQSSTNASSKDTHPANLPESPPPLSPKVKDKPDKPMIAKKPVGSRIANIRKQLMDMN